MINVIAVDSLRTLPITAPLGLSLIFYYLIAAGAFFFPVALISAELATAYPHSGGLYVWVREAFGKKAGFMTIWLQWIYNVVWYPTILAFIASTFSYLFSPVLANNKAYLLTTSIGLFWTFTVLNCFGMRLSGLISILSALFGTLLPMCVITFLGLLWWVQGHPIAPQTSSIIPTWDMLKNLPLFSGVLFGLLGIEMSAVHADEVKNPQRDYPRALLYSSLIIFSTLMFGALAIVFVIPNHELSMISGLIDTYAHFFNYYGMPWMTQIIAILIILGALGSISAWIIGPTKGLLVSAHDGSIPPFFTKTNRHGAPVRILITQGIIFTLLCTVFTWHDSVNTAYWMLSDLSAQLALVVYLFLFAAAIRLRLHKPNQERPYRIPGGNLVMYVLSGLGLLCCTITILAGFIPPTNLPIKHIWAFEGFLMGGFIVFFVLPWVWINQSNGA